MNTSLVLALALGAVAPSKLGLHVLGPATDRPTAAVLEACPRLVKWDAGPQTPGAVAAFHSRCPDSRIVLRAPLPDSVRYDATGDPTEAADDAWLKMLGQLAGITALQIAWLEGPGPQNLPEWGQDENAAAWVAAFWSRLSDIMWAQGYAPLVGAVPTGQPALDDELAPGIPNLFTHLAAAMKAKPYRWGWSYLATAADVHAPLTPLLRYRIIREQCHLQGVPIVLGDVGLGAPGWKAMGVAREDYLAWLAALDYELLRDVDVEGAALYQIGDSDRYADYDLSSLSTELAAHVRSGPSAPDAGGQPGGGDAGPGSGAGAGTGGGVRFPASSGDEQSGCGCGFASGLAPLGLVGAAALLRRRRA